MHVVEASGGVSRTSKQIEAIPNDGPQGQHLSVSDFPYFPNPQPPREMGIHLLKPCGNEV